MPHRTTLVQRVYGSVSTGRKSGGQRAGLVFTFAYLVPGRYHEVVQNGPTSSKQPKLNITLTLWRPPRILHKQIRSGVRATLNPVAVVYHSLREWLRLFMIGLTR